MNSLSSVRHAISLVYKLYMRNAPLKFIWECLLDAVRKIMIVLTAVKLLEYLTDLVLSNAPFVTIIRPLFMITSVNIVIELLYLSYVNCFKPLSDLKIQTCLEKTLMNHAQTLPLSQYEITDFYATAKQAKDSTSVVFLIYEEVIQIVGNTTAFLSAIKAAIDIDPILVVFLLFTIPMIAVSKKYGVLTAQKSLDLNLPIRKKDYAKEAWLNKTYSRQFKISNAAHILDKHYEDGYNDSINIHSQYSNKLFWLDFFSSGFSITYIAITSYIYSIISYMYLDSFNISSVSVLIVAIMNMASKIRKIYRSYERICKSIIQLDAIHKFLNLCPELISNNAQDLHEFETLEFRNVWFSYDKKKWVLKDVSFKISAGEFISIVGHNGAGKSTLIKLILGFYDADRGEILCNGININKYNMNQYRAKFFSSFQNCQAYSVSLAENIVMGESDQIARTEITNSLATMNLTELTVDTNRIIGKEYNSDGLVLSGGQTQKLALTRMTFATYEIAILDEPSSAMDPISSSTIINTIMRANNNKTVIMVSHDLSISKLANRIMFFEDGALLEIGSHQELLNLNRKYATLFTKQSDVYQCN